MRTNKSKGFTLIELLVVVAIIAVLISILLPAIGKAKDQANKMGCQSNLHQMGLGMMLYAQDNKGWLAGGYVSVSIGICTSAKGGTGIYHLYNEKYIQEPKTFYCPSYPVPYGNEQYSAKNFKGNGTYTSYAERIKREYGFPSKPYMSFFRLEELENASLMADIYCGNFAWSAHPRPSGYQLGYGWGIQVVDISGGWNVLFTDGGVSFMKLDGYLSMSNINWSTYDQFWTHWDQTGR